MTDLITQFCTPADLSRTDRDQMFAVMDAVYARMDRDLFEEDLAGKDEVIVLRDPASELVGFSTQRFLTIPIEDHSVTGIFSGDTVIHPEHWGSPALLQAFARRYIIERPDPWYWFLVSKGHRTYRMLTTFFTEFWPDRRAETPAHARDIMDAYASALYPDDYDPATGVLTYQHPKDRLRPGVAGVTERLARNPDVAHFVRLNPGHELGHDLVCLAELSPANLRPQHRTRLLGTA